MTATTTGLKLADYENQFSSHPKSMSDRQLLSLDFVLHRAWGILKNGGCVQLGSKPCNEQAIVEIHKNVRAEIETREFNHTHDDGLDDKPEATQKGLIDKKDISEFPNVVMNEEEAVSFVRKRRAA